MYCNQCGKENSDLAYFCFDCGAPTQNYKDDPAMEKRASVRRPDHLTCEQCGGRLDLDSKFCHQCGAAVQPRFCQSCGAFMEVRGNFCDRCGQPVTDDRTVRKRIQGTKDTALQKIDLDKIKEQGKKLADDAMNAGKQVATTVMDSVGAMQGQNTETRSPLDAQEYQRFPHPYHKLGGWLKVCVVCTYIYLIAESIILFISNIQSFRFVSLAAQWGGTTAEAWITIILYDLIFIAYLVYVFRFLGMIRTKDPLFLRNYHILGMILVGFSFFYSWVNKGFMAGVFAGLFQGIIFVIYIQYFSRSVRVRTYMGSEEYLRRSIFSKDALSPVPADTKPYEGQA